jgi:pyrimidine-nucleoside phosphorylase
MAAGDGILTDRRLAGPHRIAYTAPAVRIVDVIIHKRDGGTLTRDEIDFVVAGVVSGTLPDYQVSALLMAMLLRGMSPEETVALTEAMVASGHRVDLSSIPGTKVGKHSTGGVGDKTSLIVVPLVASCGVRVPKSSGRGLGHTGGTLDKLESIPGFTIGLDRDAFFAAVREVGCAFVGQTADIAPADKKLYALRDVTGTIESVPLIASSIMSKKIGEGTDALVLDVKVGRGAFMKTEADARRLAETMVAIGEGVGLRTEAVLTAMDAPLGRYVGNALEIVESLDTLKGRGSKDLETLCVTLAARMVALAGAAPDAAAAEALVRAALASGRALEKFREMIERQGGDPGVVDDYALLPQAAARHVVTAARGGYLASIDAALVGRASMALGAGRERVDERIDPGAGIVLAAKPGDAVSAGAPIAELHVGAGRTPEAALALLDHAFTIADEPPALPPLVYGVVTRGA